MRIFDKDVYLSKDGIMVNFADRVYKRRGEGPIPSYWYDPDGLYCRVIKYNCNKVILGGMNPFIQNYSEFTRFLFLLKNGLPMLKNKPVYKIVCYSDYPYEFLINSKVSDGYKWRKALSYIDTLIERTGERRTIDVQESLKRNKIVYG